MSAILDPRSIITKRYRRPSHQIHLELSCITCRDWVAYCRWPLETCIYLKRTIPHTTRFVPFVTTRSRVEVYAEDMGLRMKKRIGDCVCQVRLSERRASRAYRDIYLIIYRVSVNLLTLVLIIVDDRSRWTRYFDRDDDGICSPLRRLASGEV